MLQVSKTGEKRVEIVLEGALDAEAMRDGLDRLIAVSEDVTEGEMLYRIRAFSFPTLGALGVELRRLPSLFGLLGKFDRCAVIAEQSWIRTAAEIEGAVIPGLAIKSFEPGREAEAEAWLNAAA